MTSNSGYSCSCGFKLWIPVGDLEASSLGLYDDRRYPGRCILVLHEHATDLEELSSPLARDFMSDIQRAGQAVRRAVRAERMNYAVLGNIEPHLHAHLVPRGVPPQDPVPKRSPWEHPDKAAALPPDEIPKLVRAISEELQALPK